MGRFLDRSNRRYVARLVTNFFVPPRIRAVTDMELAAWFKRQAKAFRETAETCEDKEKGALLLTHAQRFNRASVLIEYMLILDGKRTDAKIRKEAST